MIKKALAAAVGIAISFPTLATQFNAGGARSVAMGGVGVASGRGVEAAFYNPALLSKQKSDDYDLILPYFSIDVADDDNLIDHFDHFDDKVDALDAAVDTFNDVARQSSINRADAIAATNALSKALSDVNEKLVSFDNKALRVDPGLGAGFAKPGKDFGYAVYAYNETKIAGRFLYADENIVNEYIDTLSTLATDIQANGTFNPANYANIYDPVNKKFRVPDFQSSIALVGIAISEIGISLSHEFDLGGHAVALGITPKFVRVDSALLNIIAVEEDDEGHVSSGLDDFKDEYDHAKANDTNANIDVGAAYQVAQWTFGATVRNLVPVDYKLKSDALPDLTYEMKPHARAGAAWSNDWITVATDVDLTKQDSLIKGVNLDTRFLSVGAEFEFWKHLYLRTGYRDNIGSAELDTMSFGVGLDFGFTIDVAALVSQDGDEAGFSAQIGGHW